MHHKRYALHRRLRSEPFRDLVHERSKVNARARKHVSRIAALKALGGLRTRLSDLGEVDLDKLCRDCAAQPLMNNSPVRLDEQSLRRMFEALQ